MIYDEVIGGLVITGKAHCLFINICTYLYTYLYIHKYIDVTLYLSQNAKAEKLVETMQYYKRCSSRKLNVAYRLN